MPALNTTRLAVSYRQGSQVLMIPARQRRHCLSDLLRRWNLPLNTRCGQQGLCDACLIELHDGSLRHISSGQSVTANHTIQHVRACEYLLTDDAPVTIYLPDRSRMSGQPQVVSDFNVKVSVAHAPLVRRILIRPRSDRGQSLHERILCSLSQDHSDVANVQLSDQLRQHDNQTCVQLEYRGAYWLATCPSAGHAPACLGAAVDLGTTTVAVLLVDLHDGRILSRSSAFNEQTYLGDDVLTRINLCLQNADMLSELQRAATVRTIFPLLADALVQAQQPVEALRCVSVAGNTTMLHLLAGVDPTPMGILPFTPHFLEYRPIDIVNLPPPPTSLAGLDTTFHLLPGAAAYIGADLTAGVVATGMHYAVKTELLVDVGTNGEIILKHGETLLGCATAAGPAFEGVKLTCGMRAIPGAISHIRMDDQPPKIAVECIGEEKRMRPAGLCGSAYIDFLAEARRIGLINVNGRINRDVAGERHVILPQAGCAFRIATGQGNRPITISECDIAALLQAKAAIAAGILTLLNHADLTPADVSTLHLAGGFGQHINLDNAIACGLLPGFRTEQVRFVGNTALAGAYMAMLDVGLLREMADVARQMRIIQLNHEPMFESCYIDQLQL